MTTTVILSIIFLLLSAIFSGMEIAFVSSNKLRIELNKETGKRASRVIAEFSDEAPTFITALLIGNNIALILFSSFASQLLNENSLQIQHQFWLLIAQTLITTIVVLIFGEFFPKALFRISPYRALSVFAVPFKYSIYWFPLKQIASIFSWLSSQLIKYLMPERYNEDQEGFSSVDLEYYIKELAAGQQGIDNDDEINSEIFEKALYLKDTRVKECMIPRTELHGIDKLASFEELKAKFIETRLSRLLVYEDNIDNVIGYVHHIDIIKQQKPMESNIYPIVVVPENMSARDLLSQFTKEHKSMAHVVDEYGGTAGLVTLEDLIEEIFGEIQDEHDDDEFIEKQLAPNAFIFSGRLEVDYLNDKYKLELPDGDYETLAGFIVVNNEDIPEVNETVFIANFELLITEASDNRLETIKLIKHPKHDD
ncbi:hemolysin family protein [Chitinophagales bacterium]|nr:hemolysin family protein [Chitinophagales bacterium]